MVLSNDYRETRKRYIPPHFSNCHVSQPLSSCPCKFRAKVVVSPLVSLMEDQMANLPPQLPGASLSGSHGGLREVAGTVRDLRAGRVKVTMLLLSLSLSVLLLLSLLFCLLNWLIAKTKLKWMHGRCS